MVHKYTPSCGHQALGRHRCRHTVHGTCFQVQALADDLTLCALPLRFALPTILPPVSPSAPPCARSAADPHREDGRHRHAPRAQAGGGGGAARRHRLRLRAAAARRLRLPAVRRHARTAALQQVEPGGAADTRRKGGVTAEKEKHCVSVLRLSVRYRSCCTKSTVLNIRHSVLRKRAWGGNWAGEAQGAEGGAPWLPLACPR